MEVAFEEDPSTKRGGTNFYGYFKRTIGADEEGVDVFVNPDISKEDIGDTFEAESYEGKIYIIDQTKEDGVTFDEHKVMVGYSNQLAAVKAYKSGYKKGWKVGPVTEMSLSEFKTWLQGDTTTPVQPKPSRQERKFVRDKKGHLRFSMPKAKKALLEDAKEHVVGADTEFVEKVIGPPTEVQPELDTEAIAKRAIADQHKALREGVDAVVNKINKKFPGANIRLIENIEDVWDEVASSLTPGVATPSALYRISNDQILMFRNKIYSVDRAVELALHEMFHKGGRAAFGEKFGVLLDDLANNLPEKYKAKFNEIKERYRFGDTQEDIRDNAEEFIAALAESNPEANIVKRFVAAVRRMLRKAGLVQEWTDNDIISMIAEAHGALARSRVTPLSETTITEQVQVEETGEIFDVEINAEIAMRQLGKRVNIIKQLRSCL